MNTEKEIGKGAGFTLAVAFSLMMAGLFSDFLTSTGQSMLAFAYVFEGLGCYTLSAWMLYFFPRYWGIFVLIIVGTVVFDLWLNFTLGALPTEYISNFLVGASGFIFLTALPKLALSSYIED